MSEKKHALIIGNIRTPHATVIDQGYEISWLAKRELNFMHTMVDHNRCRNIFTYDSDDQGFLIDLAKVIDRQKKIDAVLAFHDASQLDALAIANALGLPYQYDETTILGTRDKDRTRQRLASAGLTQIQHRIVNSLDEIKQFVSGHQLNKVIVKPVDGTGSADVHALSAAEMAQLDTLPLARDMKFPVLVEAFFTGTEYSVEGYSEGDTHCFFSVTEKFKYANTYMEEGHLIPGRVSAAQRQQIFDYVAQCLTALGVRSGVTHTEVMVSDDGRIEFIETHTRVGGDKIPDMVKSVTGVDLYRLQALAALGVRPEPSILSEKNIGVYSCIHFLVQQDGGKVIRRINGVEEARKIPNVTDVSLAFNQGDVLPRVHHSFDRAAFALSIADSAENALLAARQAVDKIQFELA